ncbi:MAG: hypothetical protein JO112_19055, partial [Planctomycetes bacterium]|nr:hypothetical protein [Planctomycetota bacterium]
MNEREWVACEDPDQMLRFLQHSGKLSERKARLFACAAVRRVWHLLTDERSQRAVEVAERYTDGEASRKELLTAAEQAYVAVRLAEKVGDANIRAAKMATAYAGVWTMRWLPYRLLEPPVPGKTLSDWPFAGVCLCDLLRDIFGLLPFRSRPTISPSVRAWNDGTVIRLAQAAYQERELP